MVKILKSAYTGGWSVELIINGEIVERTTFLTEDGVNRKIHFYNLRFGYPDNFSL